MWLQSYCGGEANCAEQISASDDYDPTELVCPACAQVGGAVQVWEGGRRGKGEVCPALSSGELSRYGGKE